MTLKPKTSTRMSRRAFVRLSLMSGGAAVAASVSLGVSPAQAQFVVSDPTNLVQSTISAVADGKTVLNQIEQLRYAYKQLKQMQATLKKLDPRGLSDLQSTINQTRMVYNQINQLSWKWDKTSRDFERLYTKYKPEDGKQGYAEKRKAWEKESDAQLKNAMMAQSAVHDSNASVDEGFAIMQQRSRSTEGQVSAIQAGNEILILLGRQLRSLVDLITTDSRAKMAFEAEERRKQEAADEERREVLKRKFGASKKSEGVELKPLPGSQGPNFNYGKGGS